ncbi:MAG: hypothetical protein PHE56_03285, partial [Bacteroidales bacterium]|nr:hypothetical protein [Bacteroidales bacterium]
MKKLFVAILYMFFFTVMYSQNRDLLIDHTELLNNTGFFSSKTDTHIVDGEKQLIFEFSSVTEEYIIRVYPAEKYKSYKFGFNSTSDYEVIDSVYLINDSYYQTRLKFKKIIDNPQLSILVSAISPEGRTLITEIKLFPVAVMDFGFVKKPEDMFIGEESFIDLYTNLSSNIVLSGSWNTEYPLNTRIVNNKGSVAVNVNATQTGNMKVPVSLKLKRPIRDSLGNLKYELGPLELDFNVKSSRLAFLNSDIKDVSIDEKNRYDGVEIQIDNHSQLQMQKTYRIENSEEAGGVLIAELFTKTRLTNNKVLCVLRTYNYHSQSDGFLYLKDGDNAKFITNFSVIPLTKIESVNVMRQGGTWIESNVVYPGEEILVRIEGQSLSKAKFSIEDLIISTGDTLANRNDVVELKAKVPIDARKKNPAILINNQPSGKSLNITEYEIIRPLDYIMIDYGNCPKNLLDYTGPEFTPNSIKDIVITFDNEKIDSDGVLH